VRLAGWEVICGAGTVPGEVVPPDDAPLHAARVATSKRVTSAFPACTMRPVA
jgi:hypothetical protein